MLAADLVFTLPFVGELARKGGATLAGNEDAERMLVRGDLVGVWPEGFKGIGKPFSERYKLQRFGRGGFVSAALRVKVPIIPCSVVGAEEIYPMIGNIPVAGPAARRAVHPDHAVLPVARAARPGPAALEVADRVRRADPHRLLRRRRGRRPDARLQRHRPGARDHPADALLAAHAAPRRLQLTPGGHRRRSAVWHWSRSERRSDDVTADCGRRLRRMLRCVEVVTLEGSRMCLDGSSRAAAAPQDAVRAAAESDRILMRSGLSP